MGLTLITPPAAVPLSMAEARAHLRLEDDQSEDALIAGFIRSATAWVDGAEGWLGRALISQEWELRIDCFPWRTRIVLPLPPLQAVTSIRYTDQAGAEQLLASDRYRVLGIGDVQPGRIAPAYRTTWPTTRDEAEAVRIRFVAGYGPSWNDVPEPIRAALARLVAELDCDREGEMAIPPGALEMLSPYRVRWF